MNPTSLGGGAEARTLVVLGANSCEPRLPKISLQKLTNHYGGESRILGPGSFAQLTLSQHSISRIPALDHASNLLAVE